MEQVMEYLSKKGKQFDFENDGEGGTVVILNKLCNVNKLTWKNAMLYENEDGSYYLEAENDGEELEKEFSDLKKLKLFLGKYSY